MDPLGTTQVGITQLRNTFTQQRSYTASRGVAQGNKLSFTNNVFTSNNRTFGLDQKFRITASQASRIVSGIPTSEQEAITAPFCCNADDIIGPVKGAKLATTGALAVGAGIKIGTKSTAPVFNVGPRVIEQLKAPRLGSLSGKITPNDLQKLVNNPSAQRVLDAKSGHINVIQQVSGKLLRITVPKNEFKVISVGPIREQGVRNAIEKGRFIPIK